MRGTDDLILRREDGAPPTGTSGGGSGTDGTYERQRIYLTDTIGSPVAILDNANAAVVERISYDAYGNARHHSSADLDGDGDVDGWDQALLLGAWGDDVADIADIDRNGDVDGWDQALLLGAWGAAMPAGWITYPGEDNIIGFAGYVHNKEAPGTSGGVYLARHRWYDPLLGRWLSRDPAGYVDGMNVYLYVAANPLVLVDPLGLFWSLDNFCDGVVGLFGGSGIGKQRDHAERTAEKQKEHARRIAAEGNMTEEKVAATEEYLDQGLADVDNAITDVHQAQADVVSTVLVFVPGAGVVAVAIEVGNAGVDVAQGDYGSAVTRVGLGAGLGAANKVVGPAVKRAIGRGGSAVDDAVPASTPVGKSGSPMDVPGGTNQPATIGGRDYGGHAVDQMQGRGVPPSAVENAVRHGTQSAGNVPGRVVHKYDNVTVVTERGKVVTVYGEGG